MEQEKGNAPASSAVAEKEKATSGGPISLEEGWAELEEGIDFLIQHGEKTDAKLPSDLRSRLYTLVYNMCTQKGGVSLNDQLYKKHGVKVDSHCRNTIAPKVRGLRGDKLLEELVAQWQRYKRLLGWISSIFAYVDRHYAALLQLMSLADTGINSFRLLVLDPITEEVIRSVFDVIAKSRRGEEADLVQLASVLQIFVEVGRGKLYFYQRDFEDNYLRQLKTFLKDEKERLKNLYSGEEYTAKAKEVFDKEMERAKQICHSSTEAKVAECATLLK